jgi:rhodanese-related sulfurtransferase
MSAPEPKRLRPWRTALRDAALVLVAASALALGFNRVRAAGARIPLVAEREYEVLVPCPDTVAEAPPLDPAAAGARGDLLVDARSAAEFARWHAPGARSLPFDFLDPTPADAVKRVARSGARRVVVYGDGGEPDSGHELARELAGRGIRNVFHVRGGAPALQALAPRGAP